MSEITIEGDWRKAASAQTQTADEIEQAFMDQAYAAVQSKAAPIMRAPYRLGFEIVHRNDDNTRLVGIFVFRVNQDLYYAPVFFINGSIKGTDLFYRHSAKAFVPCTERWLEYLISLSETSEGHGVPISERTNTRRQLNLQSIVEPPVTMNNRKWASSPDLKALATEAWAGIVKSAAEPAVIEQDILRTFIVEMGGFSALKKIANTAAHDHKFAQALFGGSKAANYMPDIEPIKQADPVPVLTLHTDLLSNANVKSASEKDLTKGYKFDDKREGTNDVLIESNAHRLQGITQPGVYDVLMADGSFSECLCGYSHDLLPKDNNCPSCCSDTVYAWTSPSDFAIPMTIIQVDSGESINTDHDRSKLSKAVGTFKENIDLKEDGMPSTGKMYRIYDTKSQGFSKPIMITEVKKGALGTHEIKFKRHHDSEKEGMLIINPDYSGCDPEANCYGKSVRWVPVKFEKKDGSFHHTYDLPLGNHDTLNEFIYNHGYMRGAVQKQAGEYIVRLNTRVKNSPAFSFSKLAAITALMVEGNMVEDDAEEIVKQADSDTRVFFTYKPAEMQKRGYNLRFPQFPEFYDTMNSDFNVLEQPQPTRQVVQADKDTPYIEKQRVGDRMSFDAGDNMDSQTPISLYENSKQRGVQSVFEHGVVGSLINTYDSISMIDAYMPKMQAALDCTGRTLFLFYWKPEDFSQAFGEDDQTQLENKLISNFKSFGDLVIDLLQKTREHQEGSVSLT